MKKSTVLFLAALSLIVASCAPGANPSAGHSDAFGDVYGFWYGLWHGMISMFTFIIGLFEPTIRVYEVHNNGNWYDLGFMLGIGGFASGASTGAKAVTRS